MGSTKSRSSGLHIEIRTSLIGIMLSSPGQEIVLAVQEEAQLIPVDVNGIVQPIAKPKAEELAEKSIAIVLSQIYELEPMVMDQRVFAHAL